MTMPTLVQIAILDDYQDVALARIGKAFVRRWS
jgi:hypothetical protein